MTRTLWVIGDSWTDPTYGGWGWSCGWPEQVADRLGLALVNSGRSGAGYGQVGNDWSTFGSQAARGDGAGADLVVIAGSRNDDDNGISPEAVRLGAQVTYRLVRAACPDAVLVVVGPQATSIPAPPARRAAAAVIRDEASAAGALYVDPTPWLQGRPDLFDIPDGHPNCAGHTVIADRMTPHLLYALPPVTAPAVPTPTGLFLWDGLDHDQEATSA